MKYFLISIQYVNDGTNPCGIFAYNSKEEVLSSFHSTLASNYISSNLNGFLCIVIDEYGMTIRKEDWTKPVEEQETLI